jgi:hypothetical protein
MADVAIACALAHAGGRAAQESGANDAAQRSLRGLGPLALDDFDAHVRSVRQAARRPSSLRRLWAVPSEEDSQDVGTTYTFTHV